MTTPYPLPGDHIRVRRGLYEHHGIYVGDGRVVHFSGVNRGKQSASIRLTTLERFAAGDPVEVVAYATPTPVHEVLARAVSRLNESGYHLLFNNCEHFARWCQTGQHQSAQVAIATAHAAGAGGSAAATLAGTGIVSAAAAAGLSGAAGTMSGLAGVGGAVGMGAAAGIPILGALPGAAATAAMHRAFRDDAALPQDERLARKRARAGASVGAVTGAGAALATVAVAGVPGLSAVGMTSGLATIGGVVGGGMAVGLAATIAAPAVLAVVASHLVYRLLKKRRG